MLWISSSFPPQIGGLPQYCDDVTRVLAHHVDLTIVTAPGQRPSAAAPHFECPHLGGFKTESELRVLGAALRSVVDAVRPDAVHLGHAQMAALRGLLPQSVPVCATIHGNDLSWPWVRFGRWDMPHAIRAGLNTCTVICVSEHTARLVRAHGINAPMHVVRNTCDLARFSKVKFDRVALLERFKVPADRPLLLSVGRLAARKSHMTIMRALWGLDFPFHWLVIGEGRERRRLQLARLIYGLRSRVSMPGRIDAADLQLLYNAADLFILTPVERTLRDGIDSEGFGLVYHEAAACGLPSIASDVSGCREAVTHDRTGLLVPPGDHRALRHAIHSLLTDSARRQRLGAAAEDHVRRRGGWDAVGRELLEIYQRHATEPIRAPARAATGI